MTRLIQVISPLQVIFFNPKFAFTHINCLVFYVKERQRLLICV